MSTEWISRRDAIERAARLGSENEAATLYRSAVKIHDNILVEALQERAAEVGWDLTARPTGTPVRREDLKTMTQEQIAEAHTRGDLDHLTAAPMRTYLDLARLSDDDLADLARTGNTRQEP